MRNTFNKAPGPSVPERPPGTTTGSPGNGTPGSRTPGTRVPGTRSPGSKTLWAAAAVSMLTLTGCDQIDPLKRPYMWHATGVNEQNIAAMAANPSDLVRGRNSPQRRVVVESDGVTRLWTGKQLPLLSDTPGASTSSSSSTGGGAAAPTGGGS
jgi:hypothetical protein